MRRRVYATVLTGFVVFALIVGCSDDESPSGDLATGTATISPTPTDVNPFVPPPATPLPTLAAETQSADAIPADWPTYTDWALAVSLRYPPDLIVTETTPGLGQRALDFQSPTDPSRGFVVAIVENDDGLGLEQWVSEFAACLAKTIVRGVVAGKPALFCTSQPLDTAESAVAFEHMGAMILVRTVMAPSEFDLVVKSLRV